MTIDVALEERTLVKKARSALLKLSFMRRLAWIKRTVEFIKVSCFSIGNEFGVGDCKSFCRELIFAFSNSSAWASSLGVLLTCFRKIMVGL